MKSKQAIKRLKTRGTKHTNALANETTGVSGAQNTNSITVKQAEAILIDVCLKELYNDGNKRDLDFVNEILKPNQISLPEGQPLESFWDILTNTGLIKAVIGFGKYGRLTLTSEGYQLMNQYGSYSNFLKLKMANLAHDTDLETETKVDDSTVKSENDKKEPMDGYQ